MGNFTSFQPGGNSVIDYAIASQSLFSGILSFNVGKYNPWISDHCPIHQIINFGNVSRDDEEQGQSISQTVPTTWYWDENSRKSLEKYLKSEETRAKLHEITSSTDGNKMANEMNTLLANISEKCGAKKKKKQSPGKHSSPPWYDNECTSIKEKSKGKFSVGLSQNMMRISSKDAYQVKNGSIILNPFFRPQPVVLIPLVQLTQDASIMISHPRNW